jgi:hypothetical protein
MINYGKLWEYFYRSVRGLAASPFPIQQRVTEVFREHLSNLQADDLPKDLQSDFRLIQELLANEPSEQQIGEAAKLIVAIFKILVDKSPMRRGLFMKPAEELPEIVQREVADYARGHDWKGRTYSLENLADYAYSIIFIPDADHPTNKKPSIVMLARVIGEMVIIDEDITDRPLYKELLRCGIPRDQIILAYAGEKIPVGEG